MKKYVVLTTILFSLIFLFGPNMEASALSSKSLKLNNTWHTGYMNGKSGDDPSEHIYYSFNVPSDGRVTFTTQAFKNDTKFLVHDIDQSKDYGSWTIYSGSEVSPGTEMKYKWLKKGTYYLEVANDGTSSSGNFRIKAAFLSAGRTVTEPNDSFVKAMSLAKGKTVKGVLLYNDNRYDFFKIVSQSNSDIKVKISTYGAYSYAPTEYGLGIYNSDYEELQYKGVPGGSEETPSVNEYTLSAPGKGNTYYLRVSNYYKDSSNWGEVYYATGPYTIQWTQPEPTKKTTEKQKAIIRTKSSTKKKTATKPATNVVKIGSTHIVNKNIFTITTKSSVTYKAPVSKKITVIRIPKSVKIKGKTYKVTAIGNKAFYGCKKLKKVIIKSPIKKIGKYAFYKCGKLKTIRIYSKILTKKRILTGAFKGISKKATFYLPKGKKAAYKKILMTRGATRMMKYKKN